MILLRYGVYSVVIRKRGAAHQGPGGFRTIVASTKRNVTVYYGILYTPYSGTYNNNNNNSTYVHKYSTVLYSVEPPR